MVKKSKHKYYFYQSECQKSKRFTKVKSKNQRGSTHFPSPYDKILIIQYYKLQCNIAPDLVQCKTLVASLWVLSRPL